MKKAFGVTHGIATCNTCGWTTESYKNAQAIAAKHAKDKGHVVVGEVGYAYTYDGRGASPR
jgi:hypothetical protein